MPGRLNEPGGQNSDRTIVGRKRLVKGSHGAPYGWGSFDEIDIETSISQIHRGLDTGYTATYDHDGSDDVMIVNDVIHVRTLRDLGINS